MIKEKLGNLVSDAFDYDVLCHGCNCWCVFGAGIAVDIRRAFPEAYEADCKTIPGDKNKLGYYTKAIINRASRKSLTVINCYTQFNSNPKEKPFNYQAFRSCLLKIQKEFTGKKIAFPLIGAGLAGGDWEVIRNDIKLYLDGEDVTIIYYDKQPELYEQYANK